MSALGLAWWWERRKLAHRWPGLTCSPSSSVSSVSGVGFVCPRAVVGAPVGALVGGGFRGHRRMCL